MLELVRVSCPGCGAIEVRADDVTIRACSDRAQNTYRFQCSRCDTFVIKDAVHSILLLLLRAGVRVDTWHGTEELGEPRDGSRIHVDELVGFHLQSETLPTTDPAPEDGPAVLT